MVLYSNVPSYASVSCTGETTISTTTQSDTLNMNERGVGVLLTSGNLTLYASFMSAKGPGTEHHNIACVGNFTTHSIAANTLYFMPIHVGKRGTYTKLGSYVTTTENTKKFRMGLFNDSSGLPGTLIVDGGESTMTGSSGVLFEKTISQDLRPGPYWTAFVTESTSGVFRAMPATGIGSYLACDISTPSKTIGYSMSHTYGALPSAAASLTAHTAALLSVYLK